MAWTNRGLAYVLPSHAGLGGGRTRRLRQLGVRARADPAKIVLDLAVTLAVGGDCLADIAVLRAEPGLFGLVALDPAVSRTIDRLAEDRVAALRAIKHRPGGGPGPGAGVSRVPKRGSA
jgi:hypothetical protein